MRKADNLPPSCAFVTKSGNLNFLEPSGPLLACNGTALPLHSLNPKQVCTLDIEQVKKIYIPTVIVGTIHLSLSFFIYIRVLCLRGTR